MNNRNLTLTLILLGLTVILVIMEFYFRTIVDGINEVLAPEVLIAAVIGVLFIIIMMIFIFTRRMLLAAKQERMLEVQEQYIGYLRELVKVIRAQRHDFINHMQVAYVLLKTGENQKAQKYIEDLYQDVKVTGEMLRVNIPEVSALLLVKTGIAAAKDISFTIEIDSDLTKFNIKPIDINTILGNLIDNAFEAVAPLKTGEKKVELKIFDTAQKWVIQVLNSGHIPDEIKDKVFEMGFSTKPGEGRGVGLASVQYAATKHNGKIIVNSSLSRGTRFTVIFPKSK